MREVALIEFPSTKAPDVSSWLKARPLPHPWKYQLSFSRVGSDRVADLACEVHNITDPVPINRSDCSTLKMHHYR
jgi:hypothetical protein